MKTRMPGIADKFSPSAQNRLLWPGMTAGERRYQFFKNSPAL
jgi:hypothetical protein